MKCSLCSWMLAKGLSTTPTPHVRQVACPSVVDEPSSRALRAASDASSAPTLSDLHVGGHCKAASSSLLSDRAITQHSASERWSGAVRTRSKDADMGYRRPVKALHAVP